MREPSVALLLACYVAASFTFSYSAALLGRAYHPLGAYQSYAACVLAWLLVGFAVTRPKRLWPPTKAESLSALASVMILTSETIALMLPASVVAVVAGKAGCLAIPDRDDPRPWHRKYALAALAACAVVLASVHKPLRVLLAPLALAAVYVAGNAIKLRAVRTAKASHEAKPGFLSAGQLVVCGLTLALSSAFSPSSTRKSLTTTCQRSRCASSRLPRSGTVHGAMIAGQRPLRNSLSSSGSRPNVTLTKESKRPFGRFTTITSCAVSWSLTFTHGMRHRGASSGISR